ETALGSSASSAASTPIGKPVVAAPASLTLSKATIKLNFIKKDSDSVTLNGTLDIAQGFAVAGAAVFADGGGVAKKLTLGAKGSAKQGIDSFRLSLKIKNGIVQAAPAAK